MSVTTEMLTKGFFKLVAFLLSVAEKNVEKAKDPDLKPKLCGFSEST